MSALFAEIEEGALVESKASGKQRRRELLDSGVVLLHRVVEEPARGGELFSISASSDCNCWKFWLAFRSG